MKLLLLIPLAVNVIYYDVRFRRIPNKLVLIALFAGLTINIAFGGASGADGRQIVFKYGNSAFHSVFRFCESFFYHGVNP